MKPERLEMMGFGPFRANTVVDFRDLELFALTGPTGAGKSSVIDAITFALYGSAPRYDRKSVEPVISLGSAEARVRFDFEVEGVAYTVVRVVERNPSGGANTAEARLESDGANLASGAPELTRAVESLIGLGIDHFTRSVVLPQGEFAAFLHDTPSGQQDLVKALLDMGVLESVRKAASERARTASALAQSVRSRLDHLADVTEEAEQAVAARQAALEKLQEPVTAGEEAIAEAETAAREVTGQLADLRRKREALAGIEPPGDLAQLAEDLTATRTRLEAAGQNREEAADGLEAKLEESERIPTIEHLDFARSVFDQLNRAREKAKSFDLPRRQTELEKAAASREAAGLAFEESQAAQEEARRRHAAHALVQGHRAGDPCPVCRAPLSEDPVEPPADLEAKEKAVATAREEYENAVRNQQERETALAEAKASHQAAVEAIGDLELRAANLPTFDQLDNLGAARSEMDRTIEQARSTMAAAREAEAEAQRRVAELELAASSAWEAYASQRDKVAFLAPPPAERQDISLAWAALMGWVGEQIERLDTEISGTIAAEEQAQSTITKLQDEVERLLAENEVDGSGRPSVRLAGAIATVRAEHGRIRERRAERESLFADAARFDENAAVAGSLAGHLKANRFEGWLLAEALDTLVVGANALLAELTNQAYSLALRDRIIEVVDHRNADERRSVKSLSGGETFLVSLALALSLSEQLVTLSDRGGARLEAIFLDEGFGTLDAETLETVSVVVSELAARGRAVGLVTHVKDLADQIPVRFEVRTGPAGSTIHRMES